MVKKRLSQTRFLLVAAISLLVWDVTTEACQVCIPFPKKSVADYLIEADAVVLAREDPEKHFHFSVIEVLKGNPGNEAIDLFLNSTTRRTLAANPDQSAILARMSDGNEQSWHRIGTADVDTGPVVREILKAAPAWEVNPGQRASFFAKQLGHESDQLRELAHLEISRAPYAEIRNCAGILSRDKIHAFLNDFRYIEWHPLYILLLAQSENPADHELIVRSFESASRLDSTVRLAAWATALIEIQEEEAVATIEERYFKNKTRKPEELLAVLKALSTHGNGGHVHLQDRIAASYRTLLVNHPERAVDLPPLPDKTSDDS